MRAQPAQPQRPQAGLSAQQAAATEAFNLEADLETTLAVQKVFALVRNGEAGNNGGKDANLTLDDVVRFYNVRAAAAPTA